MIKFHLLASAAGVVGVAAFMSDFCEVVNVHRKGTTGTVRVNKSDFDADQEGEKTMSLVKSDDVEQSPPAGLIMNPELGGVPVPAAPSAPNFAPANPAPDAPPAGAPVAPTVPSANTLLVKKESAKKFKIVTADGSEVSHPEIAAGDDGKQIGYPTEAAAWEAAIKAQRAGGNLPGSPAVPAPPVA
jgi:hypothetical protein